MPIITRRPAAGKARAILHLPDALNLHTSNKVVAYCRVSEATQVSNGSLDRQKATERQAIKDSGGRLTAFVYGHEYGKMSADRRHLRIAIASARRHSAILCATDVSRLVRSEAFDKQTNRLADPTPEEIERLLAMALGVPLLATIEHPDLTPAELHSLAVKRGMKAKGNPGGRKPRIHYARGVRILSDHEMGLSLGRIAERHDVSKSTVARFIARWAGYRGPRASMDAWHERNNPSYRNG